MNKLKLLFITNNPNIANYVIRNGADRVFIDLEILGKVKRQGHLDTVISRHSMDDISIVRPVIPLGCLLVRLNPINKNTKVEVDEAIQRGADILMLPMFKGVDEVQQFCEAVNFRVQVCLLVETIGAMQNLAECIKVPGVDEVLIGLNDLHLEMGCKFMFEPLFSGHVEAMSEKLREANMPFGIGGLARVGEGLLPAELLLSEHARLGSTCAILSRSFHRQAKSVEEIEASMNFAAEINKLRVAYRECWESGLDTLNLRRVQIASVVAEVANKISDRPSQVKIVD